MGTPKPPAGGRSVKPPASGRSSKPPKPGERPHGAVNPRQTEQSRKLLGKHYANKYGTVKR